MRSGIFVATSFLVGALASSVALAAEQKEDMAHEQASKVAGELGTIAGYLQSYPQMALDFTKVSGEYCLNTWKAGGAHMSHFAGEFDQSSGCSQEPTFGALQDPHELGPLQCRWREPSTASGSDLIAR